MKVEELLNITGGNTSFIIQGTTEKDEIVQVAYGKVDDIKFPLVPYGNYKIEHMRVELQIETKTHKGTYVSKEYVGVCNSRLN